MSHCHYELELAFFKWNKILVQKIIVFFFSNDKLIEIRKCNQHFLPLFQILDQFNPRNVMQCLIYVVLKSWRPVTSMNLQSIKNKY